MTTTPPENRHVLHELEFPNPAVCGAQSMYLRLPETGAALELSTPAVRLAPYSSVEFDSYFNCFSVEVWNRSAPLDDVWAEVDIDGVCELEVWNTTAADERVIVASVRAEGPTAQILVPGHERLPGIISIRIQALEDKVVFRGGRWFTSGAPRREARLGVAMTTFNRQDYVLRNLSIIDDYARSADDHLADVRVQIVDNGSNLDVDESAYSYDLRVLANRNLGGAGGFARNLMEYRNEGWATHVVFMDDDIKVSPAVIDRCRVFLSYVADEETCVSGAMLDEGRMDRQFESGARFALKAVQPFAPMREGLPLDEPRHLAMNAQDYGIEYAGWWFFAFPVALTDENPIPVFVRGDDVSFCLTHARGRIEAMNGLGVWHQAFEYKNNPMMFHLEYRNLALVSVLNDPGFDRTHFIRRFGVSTIRSLLAMKYSSAEKMMAGASDFLDGPDRWLSIDHVAELDRIRTFDGERLGLLPAVDASRPWRDIYGPLRRVRAMLAFLLLGGHLLPKRASRLPSASVPVQMRSVAAPLGREELLYYYPPTGEGFAARRDRKRFFGLLGDLGRLAARAWREFPDVADQYRERRGEFVTDEYWMRQFQLDELTVDAKRAS